MLAADSRTNRPWTAACARVEAPGWDPGRADRVPPIIPVSIRSCGSPSMRTLIHGARLVACMDDARTRLEDGWVLIEDDRIEHVGSGTVPGAVKLDQRIDARGKVVLPGLVNTHHHLPQVLTRNVPRVQEAPLFRWLTELYDVWRGFDAEGGRPGGAGGPGRAAPHRLHHHHRPPVPVPPRPGAASSTSRSRPPASWASASSPPGAP